MGNNIYIYILYVYVFISCKYLRIRGFRFKTLHISFSYPMGKKDKTNISHEQNLEVQKLHYQKKKEKSVSPQ